MYYVSYFDTHAVSDYQTPIHLAKQILLFKQAISGYSLSIFSGDLILKAPIRTAAEDIHKNFFIVFQGK